VASSASTRAIWPAIAVGVEDSISRLRGTLISVV
jgi:hypothetical protein